MSTTTTQPTRSTNVIAAINRCIEACTDEQKAYAIAAANVRRPSIKTLYQSYSDQRASFTMALQEAIIKLGGSPENQGTLMGAARRRLMEARRGIELTHDDRTVILECVRDDQAALRTYEAAFRMAPRDALPTDVAQMLDAQYDAIQTSLSESRSLLDMH